MSSQDPFTNDPSRYSAAADNLPAEESPEDQITNLTSRLDQLAAEHQQLRDQQLRAAADLDNYKKRVRRDQADALRYGAEPLIRDILPVVDNLERAVAHAAGGNGDSLAQGVTLVLRSLHEVLRQHGVRTVEAQKGEPFDPKLHEAVDRREVDGEANCIVEQWEQGYQMHDRLLRPARVVVSASRTVAPGKRDD